MLLETCRVNNQPTHTTPSHLLSTRVAVSSNNFTSLTTTPRPRHRINTASAMASQMLRRSAFSLKQTQSRTLVAQQSCYHPSKHFKKNNKKTWNRHQSILGCRKCKECPFSTLNNNTAQNRIGRDIVPETRDVFWTVTAGVVASQLVHDLVL